MNKPEQSEGTAPTTPRSWNPEVETLRRMMMERFSDKLSMEEIAGFAYELAASSVPAQPADFQSGWKAGIESAATLPASVSLESATPAETTWLVECVINGKSDGWWTGVPKGTGGWITTDALEAKRYTKNDAELVAKTLDYFPSPFHFSHWIATEHIFTGVSSETQTAPSEK